MTTPVVVRTFVLLALLAAGPVSLATPAGDKPAQADVARCVVEVREVLDRSPDAAVEVRVAGDTLRVDAISPKGIGGVRLKLAAGRWPKNVVVQLRYAKDRSFKRLEGSGASLENPTPDAKDKPLPLKVRQHRAEGLDRFELEIPPGADRPVLHLHWVDAYRG